MKIKSGRVSDARRSITSNDLPGCGTGIDQTYCSSKLSSAPVDGLGANVQWSIGLGSSSAGVAADTMAHVLAGDMGDGAQGERSRGGRGTSLGAFGSRTLCGVKKAHGKGSLR